MKLIKVCHNKASEVDARESRGSNASDTYLTHVVRDQISRNRPHCGLRDVHRSFATIHLPHGSHDARSNTTGDLARRVEGLKIRDRALGTAVVPLEAGPQTPGSRTTRS